MSTIAKVFTVLNLVFSLFIVGTVASILSKTDDYRAKLEAKNKQYDDDMKTKDEEINGLKGEKANLDSTIRTKQGQLDDSQSELRTKSAEAEQTRNDNNQLRNSVDAIQASLKTLQGELSDVQGRNKELTDANEKYRATSAQAEKDMHDAQDDRARLEGDLKRANDDIAEKDRQLASLDAEHKKLLAEREALVAQGVDIAALVGNTVPLIPGKVNEVNMTEKFVVLSVGANDGVQVGFPFDVYRGNNYIGRVVVNKVLPDTCTARITLTNANAKFQPLDDATTRL